MPRRRGGRAIPPPMEPAIVIPEPSGQPLNDNSPLDEAVLAIQALTPEEKQTLRTHFYQHGDLTEFTAGPNDSDALKLVGEILASLDEAEIASLSENAADLLGGRRRRGRRKTVKKSAGKRRKTRRRN